MSLAGNAMERYYAFAGVELCIRLPENQLQEAEHRLAPFRVDAVASPHCFRFVFREKLPQPRGSLCAKTDSMMVYRDGDIQIRYLGPVEEPYIRVEYQGREHCVQLLEKSFTGAVGTRTVLGAIGAEHLVVEAGGVILHCSYIDIGGKAILFTAPSGTGKSTQAELWKQLRSAEIINGDRAAMRFADGKTWAMGIPFAGSSPYCENRTMPLAAIVCLGQAKKTTIRRLTGFAAFRRVWEGCSVNSWDRADMEQASATVSKILNQVPVFALDCTPDESAVIALEQAMQEV